MIKYVWLAVHTGRRGRVLGIKLFLVKTGYKEIRRKGEESNLNLLQVNNLYWCVRRGLVS